MNLKILVVLLIALPILACARSRHESGAVTPQARADTVSRIRAELERLHDQNTAAFLRWDFAPVMALRAPDFPP